VPLNGLHAEVDGQGPRLVLVHGFTQNRNCWGPVAVALGVDHEVVRVDAPGHGRSSAITVGLEAGATLIADTGGRATYVGYSMGGRFVLHVALLHAPLVAGLVLIGATAGLDDPAARAERRRRDADLAARLERDGLERFLDDWLAQPLFATLPEAHRFRAERRDNTVEGLAASLRLTGAGAQQPLRDRLQGLDMPVLVVAGQHDDKFSVEAARLAEAIGANATRAVISGAGHAAHLEQPDAFLSVLRPWLAEHRL
jgi:2-succinyl-6-hydroxy-2,4-cyclohexadiene-1-carboxylate synthase